MVITLQNEELQWFQAQFRRLNAVKTRLSLQLSIFLTRSQYIYIYIYIYIALVFLPSFNLLIYAFGHLK